MKSILRLDTCAPSREHALWESATKAHLAKKLMKSDLRSTKIRDNDPCFQNLGASIHHTSVPQGLSVLLSDALRGLVLFVFDEKNLCFCSTFVAVLQFSLQSPRQSRVFGGSGRKCAIVIIGRIGTAVPVATAAIRRAGDLEAQNLTDCF